MDKLRMQTLDGVQDNIDKIAALFPNCITERKDAEGKVTLAIDFDKLRQELSSEIVEGREERYQFTWPDKKKAILLANSPINATLRPCRKESVDFDNTQNLYIEGDNLDVLKCLKETYLGKVKMIYIDPPYNTGNDFVYEDDFAESTSEYLANSGQYDEQGNRLVTNSESNGRFHTDWLNMIYPRLKVARDLLTEDGVIFVSIDDNEVENLKKVCDEIFGERNFLTTISRATGTPTGGGFDGLVNELDYVLVYSKNINNIFINGLPMSNDDSSIYDQEDEFGRFLTRSLRRTGGEDRREDRPTMFYPIIAPDGTEVYPKGPTGYDSRWICSEAKFKELDKNHLITWKQVEKNGMKMWQVHQKFYLEGRTKAPGNLWTDVEGNKKATRDIRMLFDMQKVFDFPKPVGFLKKILTIGSNKDSIVLDFFSGSCTTAHAVMQLNLEDGGSRKFIMVQLFEQTDANSEAYKAGYKNICEIGKERIRRAGKKVKEELVIKQQVEKQTLDIGFRVLKLDSSNMEDIYYSPVEYNQQTLFTKTESVKSDRTSEDLLFQVMLELGATLDSKIEQIKIEDKTIYNVADNYLVACFDNEINDSVVTAIAKMQPQYAVFRDSSMADDSTATNFEQIFRTYSPNTTTKVL